MLENSWFEGRAHRVLVCTQCEDHIGFSTANSQTPQPTMSAEEGPVLLPFQDQSEFENPAARIRGIQGWSYKARQGDVIFGLALSVSKFWAWLCLCALVVFALYQATDQH